MNPPPNDVILNDLPAVIHQVWWDDRTVDVLPVQGIEDGGSTVDTGRELQRSGRERKGRGERGRGGGERKGRGGGWGREEEEGEGRGGEGRGGEGRGRGRGESIRVVRDHN